MNRVVTGMFAGAIGTLALNAATFADMALRGRPASAVPDDTIQHTARRVGFAPLARGDETARHRREGLGLLSGYAAGLGVGALYGLLRPSRRLPAFAEALAVGAAAMVPGNAGAVAAGTTDPRRWTLAEWTADVVPHLCFGAAVVASHRALIGATHS